MCCDIGESTPLEVSKRSVVSLHSGADFKVQVKLNSEVLVCRTREVVAEATGRANPGLFRANGDSSANGKYVGASTGELGCELRPSLPIVALARSTDTVVTGGLENGDTAET